MSQLNLELFQIIKSMRMFLQAFDRHIKTSVRPISILPALSKITQRLMFCQIDKYIPYNGQWRRQGGAGGAEDIPQGNLGKQGKFPDTY